MQCCICVHLHPALYDVSRLLMLHLQPLLVTGGCGVGHKKHNSDPVPLLHLSHSLSPAISELPVTRSTGDHDQHPVTGVTWVRRLEEADIPLQSPMIIIRPDLRIVTMKQPGLGCYMYYLDFSQVPDQVQQKGGALYNAQFSGVSDM